MDIRVSGQHVEVGDAFRTHASQRMQAIADKYFSRAMSSQVTLAQGAHGHGFHVDCSMHVRRGVLLKAEANGGDAHGALEGAAERIEKQLRRYARKLKNHHADSKVELPVAEAPSYVVQAHPGEEEVPAEAHPVIIAESKVTIPTVSVSDAVMLMDLAHAPAMMFRNVKSGQLAMVYHRSDGHIGWVEGSN